MAVKLVASYSKRLGLPAYSSHQFSVSIEAELSSADDIAQENSTLYQTLQRSVDQQIQEAGFVPSNGYGLPGSKDRSTNGYDESPRWHCTDKQRQLILKIIEDNSLDKTEIEAFSRELFDGKGVKQLDKSEASMLISELLEKAERPKAHSPREGRRTSVPATRPGRDR